MRVNSFGLEVGDQKPDNVAFDRLATHNDEAFGTHHHELREFLAQTLSDFIRLNDGSGNSPRIHATFDENALPPFNF